MTVLYRGFTAQAEIDAQYDVEKSVPDFTVYARHFIDESKLARYRLRCELDVPYGPTRDEHLDVFPGEGRRAPILVFFHGGYWRMLSSKEFSCVALGPATAGVAVLNVNYSLCPKVGIEEIVRQCRAAVAWAWKNAERFGGDPDRLYVSGHSAGGHIVGMLLATDWAAEYGLPAEVIKGAMPVSGLFDLQPFRYSWLQPMLQLTAESIERASPLFHVRRSAAPMLVTWGASESSEFDRQSREYLAAWERAGNRGEPWPQPDANHFTAIYGFEDPKSELCRRLFRLMGLSSAR
jgi:arylformamidase